MRPESTMKRIERVRRDESGMTYVFIGLSMMAFIGGLR